MAFLMNYASKVRTFLGDGPVLKYVNAYLEYEGMYKFRMILRIKRIRNLQNLLSRPVLNINLMNLLNGGLKVRRKPLYCCMQMESLVNSEDETLVCCMQLESDKVGST